jgi:membrane associated rhomboid family serine protease
MATCFHHSDRETGRACTRCGRPACPDCLIQASVGSQCWECVRAGAPPRTAQARRFLASEKLLVTKSIVAITVVAYIYGLTTATIPGTGIREWEFDMSLLGPLVANGENYRLLTHSLVHFSLIHIGFNMLILYQVGMLLEPAAGRTRFLLLYIVSILGGAAGALLLSPESLTGGASGGVFGVAAAATLTMYRYGQRFSQTAFGPLLVINLALGFFISNVSVGGHIGGLIAGTVATEAMLQARKVGKPYLGIVGAIAVGIVSIAIALAAADSSSLSG